MTKEICDKSPCPMQLISAFDNGDNIAYNLYQCNRCGMLVKYDVWDNAGRTFLLNDNTLVK